jgi:hypothetical protein
MTYGVNCQHHCILNREADFRTEHLLVQTFRNSTIIDLVMTSEFWEYVS